MKKFYFQLLLAFLVVGFGFNASAATVTFEWTAPEADAVTLKTSVSGTPIELPDGATSYTFEESGAFIDAYIVAKDGYYFKSITPSSDVIQKNPYYHSTYGWYVGGRFNATQLAALNGAPVKFEVAKIERDEQFTINVINGSADLSVKFTASMPVEYTVQNGLNTINFLPAIDKTMQITTKTGLDKQSIYSIKLNGVDIPVKFNRYYEFTPKSGDNVEIRVYEGEEIVKHDVTLTLDLPEALKDCIYTIRDWSAGKFVTDLSNLTFAQGTDIAVNLQPEYNYEKIYLNDQDVTDKLNTSGAYPQIRFDLEENTVLKIEGSIKDGTVDFNAYIVNPEGVILRLGTYGSETVADLTDGAALTGDITIGDGYTIKADEGKLFTVPVSEINPRIFIFAKEGYYIETAQTKIDGAFEEQTSVNGSNSTSNTFYVIARPYVNDAKIKFDVRGDAKVMLSGAMSKGYDNPEPEFTLTKGIQTVEFCANLSAPLRLRYYGLEEGDIATYYDGLRLSHDEDSELLYTIPAPGEYEIPTVVVKNTTTPLAAGTVSVTGDPEAKVYYGEYENERPATDSYFLFGTTIMIKPSAQKFTATLNGEPLAADWQGRLFFDIASVTNKVVINANTFALAGVTPEAGSTVKSLSQLVFAIDYDGSDEMPYLAADKLQGITLSTAGTTISAKELGEMSMNDFGQLLFPVIFDGEFAAGEYTLTVPAGTFCMAAYDDNANGFVPVQGGATSAEFKAAYTVDPTMKGKLEEYTLTPADGSALKTIEQIVIAFPAYTAYEMGFNFDETGSYISDGTTEYAVTIGYDWSGAAEGRAFTISPLDADDEPFELTADATWTLHLAAGAISKDGEETPVIEAEFKTGASLPVYNITPVAGSELRSFSEFKISFPGVYEIEYLGEEDLEKSIYYTNAAGAKTYVAEVKVPYEAGYATLLFNSPTVAGEYTLVIPEGAFKLDYDTSLACEAKYTLVVDWTLSPENGTVFSELPEFTLEFPDATTVEFVGGGASALLRAGYTWGIALNITPVEGAEHPTFKLATIDGAGTPPNGALQLEIEEGSFIIDGQPSGAIAGNYRFYRELTTDYQLDPANGVIVWGMYGAYWTIIFDEASSVRNNGPLPSAITLTLNGEPLAFGDYDVNIQGHKVLFGIYDASILKEGTLEMTIAAGALLFDGKEVPEIKASFELYAPKEYSYVITPDPAIPTASLDEITITFPEAKTVSVYMESGASLRSSNYTYFATPAMEVVEDADVPTVKLTLNTAPTDDGKYILSVFTGSFVLDSYFESPEIKADFTLDALAGVEGIEIDATEKAIYNLQGIRLDVEWSELPAGIYIVNGKKVAKK